MADCSKCFKSLKKVAKAKVSCTDCAQSFHASCVNMSSEDLSYIADQGGVWRCEPCSQLRRKSMKLDSQSNVSYDDIYKLVMEIRDDFKRVETSLSSSLNACHEEIAEIKARVTQQREELTSWMKVVGELKTENATLRKLVTTLESRIDEAEQYSRRNTLEIYGIPMETGENVISVVKSVGRALDYPVDDGMIDAYHRLRNRDASGKPPGIVIKMVRRVDAEGLLQKRRVKRNLNTHDIGLTSKPAEAVYVNESLAPGRRRRLLNAARQVKKDKSYTYLWIRGGKFLMRKNSGDRVHVLSTLSDLDNLLCDPIDPSNKDDIANLLEIIAENIVGVLQSDKKQIDYVCDIMVNKSVGTPIDRLAAENNVGELCLEYRYDNMIQGFRATSWEKAGGDRQWWYQKCTEFGYFHSSESIKALFGEDFPVDFLIQKCRGIFGKGFTKELVYRAVERSNIMYGGLDLKATRVVYVHGSIDPWHALGITKTRIPESPAIYINGTSHCDNMDRPAASDPPALKAAREEISMLIGKWLQEP